MSPIWLVCPVGPCGAATLGAESVFLCLRGPGVGAGVAGWALCCSHPAISAVMVSWTAALLTAGSMAAGKEAAIAGGTAFCGLDGSLPRHHCSADTDAESAGRRKGDVG